MSLISRPLLKWYDANARRLPWRVGPAARRAGERPDPYRVWLSEIMLQQTTVATVRPRFQEFISRWPSVEAMATASLDDVLSEWAGLGYYARARNLHKCAIEVARAGGFPETEEGLRTLPGIGPYTAAAIAAIAFDAPAIVMDGNIERVAARLFAIETPLPKAKTELKDAIGAVWPKKRSGDFAQALMDLGAGVCSPRSPKCLMCPLSAHCQGREKGIAESLPRKAKKSEKPTRRGIAYALINSKGEILFERRPEKGLLGGMLGLPGTEWISGEPPLSASRTSAPQAGEPTRWRRAGTVTHTFTHFHLELDVMVAFLGESSPDLVRRSVRAGMGSGRDGDENDWRWIAPEKARLPTVMKKAVEKAASDEGGED